MSPLRVAVEVSLLSRAELCLDNGRASPLNMVTGQNIQAAKGLEFGWEELYLFYSKPPYASRLGNRVRMA